ncbi:MAG TPA: sigma-54-dependent Fis family transcriptional regulator [Desulfonauticus sp.]|nr:MAG: Two component, sigma54 specific, transcriptional regulator, Fis family [Desulfonauticus sp. 38_4375]HCO12526.1 sigma-54-dependent Fis family transcriptional regulator [Desulfonauticus sp.]
MNNISVLLVDDEKDFVDGLVRIINRYFKVRCFKAYSAQDALEIIDNNNINIVLTDLRMPGLSGLDLVKKIQSRNKDITCLVLTAYGSIESAVEAMRAGAYDFLTKPISPEQLKLVLGKVLERSKILEENRRLRKKVFASCLGGEIVGESKAIQTLKEQILAVAETDFTVLIRGESGTGKELVARKIHELSKRGKESLFTVNCPAIPATLLESELFGHVKGAFTGAQQNYEGLLKRADGSTVLLDEIGDIGLEVQAKLLRFLQEKEIKPVGGSKSFQVDVRILASTNQPLEEKIKEGTFREDLFYRLNVLEIRVPALRERREDIPLLATYFVQRTCTELQLEEKELSPEVLTYLANRDWPGNVRELQNFVRRLVVFSKNKLISAEVVNLVEMDTRLDKEDILPYKAYKKKVLDDFTRTYFQKVLEKTRGNISQAARLSGIERVSLQKIIKRVGLKVSDE